MWQTHEFVSWQRHWRQPRNAVTTLTVGSILTMAIIGFLVIIQVDQKVSVHLMITIRKVAINAQSVPRQSPDIYWKAELCSRRPCSV